MAATYTQLDPASKKWTGSGTDGVWADYDLFTNQGVPKGAVAEIIIANIQAGTENITGVRADGSALDTRYVDIHEAEGGGETHVRMFVTCHATTGLIEVYGEDISDAIFYVVGYWEGVTFTELATTFAANASGSWGDEILASATANMVCHILAQNKEDNVNNLMGVRVNGSSLDRYINIHEPETGGASYADFLVKADANYTIDVYSEDATNADFINMGYFGTEMSFTEKWQTISVTSTGWQEYDLTAYLDADGRHCDFWLGHGDSATAGITIGARDADTTIERSLVEHEAEGGGDNTEYTGFGMSVKSSATGVVDLNISDAGFEYFYLAGYYVPNVAPTVALGTNVVDTASITDTTPSFEFTGTDTESNDIRYNIQIDTIDTFYGQFSSESLSDSNPTSYQDSTQDLFNTGGIAVGQTFTGDGRYITKCSFYLYNLSGLTGSAYAKVYELTGTPGTNAKPVGDPIATSNPVDVSTIGSSYEVVDFTFSSVYKTTNTTHYGISLEYSGGSLGSGLSYGTDETTPADNGNGFRYYSTSWSSTSYDVIYYLYTSDALPLISHTSNVETAAFVRTADSDPFTSGQEVVYTVPGANALPTGDTYYWRVRGLDPSGSNTYGAWSSTRSFTISAGTAASSDRGLYSKGKVASSSDRLLYSRGKLTNSSDRLLYSKGGLIGSSDRLLYSKGTSSGSSDRGLYTKAKLTDSSERLLYSKSSASGSSDRLLYSDGSLTSSSERLIYSEGSVSASSDRGLYSKGVASSDSDRLLYTKGVATSSSDRLVRTTGKLTGSSDRLIYTEGNIPSVEASSERLLYSKGSVAGSSDRLLYTKGVSTGSSDRGLYTKGSLASSSDRLLYSKGGLTADSDRLLHSEGSISQGSDRLLYTKGVNTDSSERGLYSKAVLGGESDRLLYSKGVSTDSSDRLLYTKGSIASSSERLLHSKGINTGSSDRLLYTEGSISDTSDRLVYSKGIATSSGERLVYSKGSILASSERQLYSKGISTSSSDRLIHTIGSLSDTSERLLYSKGVDTSSSDRNIHSIGGGITSSDRLIHSTGSVVSSSDRLIYTTGQIPEGQGESDKLIYTKGVSTSSSERNLHSIGGGITSSERLLYSSGEATSDSARGLYSRGSSTPVDWSGYWECNEMTTLDYIYYGIENTDYTTVFSNGEMVFTQLTSTGRYIIDHTLVDFDNAAGGTLEARVKGDFSLYLDIDPLWVQINISGASKKFLVNDASYDITIDTSEYHTYRITGIGDTGKLYIDGALVTTLTDTGDWGVGWEGIGLDLQYGSASVDYLYYSTEGIDPSSLSRKIYTKGSVIDSSERTIYTEGGVEIYSERGLFTKGVASSSSERNLHTIGGVLTSSDRGIYTSGRVLTSSDRTLYTQGASTGVAKFKRWNGTAWVSVTLKRYNGSTWDTEIIKRYNGSTWEDRA